MSDLNAKRNNNFVPNIDTRSTRVSDAKITLGVIAVEFKDNRIKLLIDNPAYRDLNKNLFVQIERVLNKHIGADVTTKVCKQITAELMPLAVQIDTNI